MIDITQNYKTLRTAIARAVVRVSKVETMDAIANKHLPEGDVFEIAKTAGLFAVKNTANMIPTCHPIPIDFTSIVYSVEGLDITIDVTVKAIYKIGVEMEAMHGASVVALTIYYMLISIDNDVEIKNIRLIENSGGKSDWEEKYKDLNLKATVVVCSDTISTGQKEDKAGLEIMRTLKANHVDVINYVIIPDERIEISNQVMNAVSSEVNILIFTGGTGLSIRDVTPETILPLLDRRMPGVEEAIRSYGQERTPNAMLSRSIVGVKGKTLIIALPGSTKGARESMEAIFPAILHVFKIFRGTRHD